MNGVIMNSFVYLSNNYREAWKAYIENSFKNESWEIFDDHFKEQFFFKLEEEKLFLKKVNRPGGWYINDKLGEHKFLFNMSNDFYPIVEYEYTDNLPSFTDIMLERAIEMRDMGKVIDVFYSGGIDSVSVLLALAEVCPYDQINVVTSGWQPIKEYPKAYKSIISNVKHTIDEGNIFGAANISNNLFTTGCEADRLFGSTGYPHSRNTNTERYTYEEDYEYHHSRWWEITRYTLLTQSFRFLQNIKVDSFDMSHYQPFFLSPQIEKFAINQHIDREIVWHTNHWSKPEDFLKTKMAIRDFIARWDKEYAYTMVKTDMPLNVQREMTLPIPSNYNAMAITSDGQVVNRQNIMDYMKREYLTL